MWRRSQRRVSSWEGDWGVWRVERGGRVRERMWAFMNAWVVWTPYHTLEQNERKMMRGEREGGGYRVNVHSTN